MQLLQTSKTNMKNDNRPIGVFDSGLGGLTVLKALKDLFPNESFIYFGDTAHLPYGTKSKKTIIEYSNEICDFLNKKNVKLIVVACNTASALAFDFLEKKMIVPIVNVIDPCVKYAATKTKKKSIAVLGTRATINSKSYENKLIKINSNFKISSHDCPLFVPLIEEGLINHKITKDICDLYLDKNIFKSIDILILGCTHYPLLIHEIEKYFSQNIIILDSAKIVALYVEKIFKKNILLTAKKNKKNDQYYLTDKSIEFNKLAAIFLKESSINIKYIKL